jgi:phosphoserine phosphatase
MARFRTVVFDCDSTLSAIEGIDELAHAHRAEVVRLTGAAMAGAMPLEAVYDARLDLVRPTRDAVAALGRRYVEAMVPDARETIAALRRAGVTVRIISGGLLPAVLDLARALGVAPSDVAAVEIHFDAAGRYAGFDTGSPLAREGGKRDVLAAWRDELPRPILFVGDGATDLEAKAVVDAFVAFAGVVARPAVVGAADVVVTANSLAPVFALALGEDRPLDAESRLLYERGAALLDGASMKLRAVADPAAPNPSQP